jgi:hypothetical protein
MGFFQVMRTDPDEDQAEEDRRMMRLALDEARAAAEAGETPVGAVILDPKTGEVLAGPATGRSAPTIPRPTPRSRPARRGRQAGELPPDRPDPGGDAGALRHVRRGDQPRADRPGGVRGRGSQGRGRGPRPEVLRPAHLPLAAGGDRRGDGPGERRPAARVLQGAAEERPSSAGPSPSGPWSPCGRAPWSQAFCSSRTQT